MKFYSVQYLRAIAAMAVVLQHASTSLLDRKAALIPFGSGVAGVDLFFVISGFIMFYTTDVKAIGCKEFYRRRLIRIVPLYFLLTTFAYVIATISPNSFNTLSANFSDYLRSIFFIPFYNTKVGRVEPEINQGWTLNYEMFFYLVFGLLLLFSRTKRLPLCTAVFTALIAFGSLWHTNNVMLTTYSNSVTLEFLLGMLIAEVQRSAKAERAIRFGLIAAAGVVLVVQSMGHVALLPRCMLYGLPAAALVSVALQLERDNWLGRVPFLLLVGDASYSLYLVHGFVLGAIRRPWAATFGVHSLASHAAFMSISALITTVIAILLYRTTERPITRYLTEQLVYTSKHRVSAAYTTSG